MTVSVFLIIVWKGLHKATWGGENHIYTELYDPANSHNSVVSRYVVMPVTGDAEAN